MILTEEQRGTVGLDLEKARAEVDTASSRRFSESREQARIFCAEEILPDALDEIERLRAENAEALESLTAAYLLGRHTKAQATADLGEIGDPRFCDCEVRTQLAEAIAEIKRLKSLIDKTAKNFLKLEPGVQWEGGIDEAMLALVNEIERLRKIIDSPLEEESWKADYDLLHQLDASGTVCVARKWHAAYRKAQNSNLLRKQENERLRAALDKSEQILAHKTKTSTHWYDEHLQARADRVQTRRVVEQQAARIKALEDALVEERVIGEGGFRAEQCEFWYIEDLPEESCMELDGPCDWAKCPRKHELCDVAYQQLAEEGKIGPDADAKPRVWQITEERKAAIKELSELLTAIGCPSCHYYIQKNYGENITVLRAMLTEAAGQ